MLTDKNLLSYRDVMIEPQRISKISSRKECNPFLHSNILPIFTAPMSTVVGEKSWKYFENNGIIPIYPRNVELDKRLKYAARGRWAAFSLKEFKENFCNPDDTSKVLDDTRVLIDVANGHMKQIYDMVREAKKIHGIDRIRVMIGNIANPKTIEDCIKAGVDYVRCGVGAGYGCITTSNTSIHYPMASLIDETYKWRSEIWNRQVHRPGWVRTKIIADGGIRGYGDVIKALALGADYVMIGGLFAGCLEAEGDFRVCQEWVDDPGHRSIVFPKFAPENITYQEGKFYLRNQINNAEVEVPLERVFYGMASKRGQCDISGSATKTAEGIVKTIPITITIRGWVENMISYLRSAMSYCDCEGLEEIYNKMVCNPVSAFSSMVINK